MNLHRRPQGAFTLMELLLVLLLVGVLAGLALPSFGPAYSRIQLKETANQILYLMQYAQSRAIIKRKTLGLQFDSSRTHYNLVEIKKDPELPSAPEYPEKISGRFGRFDRVPEKILIES